MPILPPPILETPLAEGADSGPTTHGAETVGNAQGRSHCSREDLDRRSGPVWVVGYAGFLPWPISTLRFGKRSDSARIWWKKNGCSGNWP